jgi:hypothetical protein
MFISLVATGLLALGGTPASSATVSPELFHAATTAGLTAEQPDPWYPGSIRARLWVDGDRDQYRAGERLRVRFSTSEDAHVALIHVDPDGRMEFLFPSSPWESDLVRGGRSHSLPRAYQSGLAVRGRPGIGYLYLIASPAPLDYRHFSRGRGSPWDWSYGGQMVRGDPFWAMEQISRLLVPEYAPYATDYYSYHVGGRHQYPSYACADRYGAVRGGWGWSSSYGPCSRLDLFLRQHPYYYDARRYRGDRRGYLTRTYGRPPAVQHRFKEPALGDARRGAAGGDARRQYEGSTPGASGAERRVPLRSSRRGHRRPGRPHRPSARGPRWNGDRSRRRAVRASGLRRLAPRARSRNQSASDRRNPPPGAAVSGRVRAPRRLPGAGTTGESRRRRGRRPPRIVGSTENTNPPVRRAVRSEPIHSAQSMNRIGVTKSGIRTLVAAAAVVGSTGCAATLAEPPTAAPFGAATITADDLFARVEFSPPTGSAGATLPVPVWTRRPPTS